MSTAKIDTVEVKPAIPAVMEEIVTLTMSRDEAEAVRVLLAHCLSGVVYTYNVFDTLDDALGGRYDDKYQIENADGDRIRSLRIANKGS